MDGEGAVRAERAACRVKEGKERRETGYFEGTGSQERRGGSMSGSCRDRAPRAQPERLHRRG